MEIIQERSCWDTVDGKLEWVFTRILYRQDGVLFCAQSPVRDFKVGDPLEKIVAVRPEEHQPAPPPGCTIAPSPDDGCFVKQPNLMIYGDADYAPLIPGHVLNEVAVCEIIRKHPHPNVAVYHGCVVSDNRITGLCFKRYQTTLLDMVNPRCFNKTTAVQAPEWAAARAKAVSYLPGIEAGIKHLHSLGFIHNDLNPANIMITEDDVPVVIDFGSCKAPGTDLRTGRTYGWHDPEVKVAQPSNDLDAIKELRIYLTGPPEEYQFPEW